MYQCGWTVDPPEFHGPHVVEVKTLAYPHRPMTAPARRAIAEQRERGTPRRLVRAAVLRSGHSG